MSTLEQLSQLGLTVQQNGPATEARMELGAAELLNPLTRSFLTAVTFTVVQDRLLVIHPPELVGLPPISLSELTRSADIESRLVQGLHEHIFHLQRRSSELQTLGVPPEVEPESLTLSASLAVGDYEFGIVSDKRGQFRVSTARRGGEDLTVVGTQGFELSEFRDRTALEDYLRALYGDVPARTLSPAREQLLSFGEITKAFGSQSLLPPRTALEVLVELKVEDQTYRFAAARVHGQTFRGLLAGAKGKLWAERFDLDGFPGVTELVARVLRVSLDRVQLVAPGSV